MKKRSGATQRRARPPGGARAVARRTWDLGISVATQFTALRRQKSAFKPDGRIFTVNFDEGQLKARLGFVLEILSHNEWDLGLRFADVAESKNLNSSYRRRAYPTDVLSFSAYEENRNLLVQGLPDAETRRLGDLSICVPVCLVQSKERRVSLSRELERMIIHGLCHLRDFDHERSLPAERTMAVLEAALRRELVSEFGQPQWASNMEWM